MKSTWSQGPISQSQTSLSHELWKVPQGPRSTTAPTRPPPGLTNSKPSSTWSGTSLGLAQGWSGSYSSGERSPLNPTLLIYHWVWFYFVSTTNPCETESFKKKKSDVINSKTIRYNNAINRQWHLANRHNWNMHRCGNTCSCILSSHSTHYKNAMSTPC